MVYSISALEEQALDAVDGKREQQQKLLEEILSSVQYPRSPDFLPFARDGVYFDVVVRQEELLEAFRLRLVAYAKVGNLNPENYPLGIEFDKYDMVSVHLFGRSQSTGELVGYARLILDTPSRMHIDDLIDISDYRAAFRISEMSRMISYPLRQPHVNKRIRYATYMWAQMLGLQKIVGISLESRKDWFSNEMLFVPMEPYRRCPFDKEKNFEPKIQDWMYGNIFHLDKNKDHILSLW